jgi:hypothetical protein
MPASSSLNEYVVQTAVYNMYKVGLLFKPIAQHNITQYTVCTVSLLTWMTCKPIALYDFEAYCTERLLCLLLYDTWAHYPACIVAYRTVWYVL